MGSGIPKVHLYTAIVLCYPLIGCFATESANQRAVQNNYWALGYQNLYFFILCYLAVPCEKVCSFRTNFNSLCCISRLSKTKALACHLFLRIIPTSIPLTKKDVILFKTYL